jgi:prepilin-type N-terminal cleavage/methylation domain-containing protein
MLNARRGFTLAEVLVAMTIATIVGAAITGVFISQVRFFDTQEKTGFARAVSRGATNMIMSEMRMLDPEIAFVNVPTRTRVTVRVPYVMGAVCTSSSSAVTFSRVPADTFTAGGAIIAGYWYRAPNGINQVVPVAATALQAELATTCTGLNPPVRTWAPTAGGGVFRLPAPSPAIAIKAGTPLFLFQVVTYEFRASDEVPGHIALWRTVQGGTSEELVAPFDSTAGFRFYVDDGPVPQASPPAPLSRVTGLELTLHGLSERPRADGTLQRVELVTSVFFRNRRI